ncbi:MAG: magnesium-translocating P-type ATPase [Candidatus Methanoperedens sp.]|nr:magnesium-translocating P-type ATPase [Candidatus Methanoperedens sp.]
MDQHPLAFWSLPAAELLSRLKATPQGLTGDEARQRLARFGSNLLLPGKRSDSLALFLTQFKSPITLILLFAAGLSFFLHEHVDVLIILAIVFISGILGFWQERGAANAIKKLLAIVQIKAAVLRDGSPIEIPVEEIVPGDVIILNGGDIIPGDCLILESKDLFVDEATLTGETYPVEKSAGVLPEETQLSQRDNALFMGTHVVSGSAKAVVVCTGTKTEFGKVSERLKLRPTETEFERGVRRFGYLLMEITLLLVISIFAINAYLGRPVLESLLFSLALAVGLTPQLLPAIISVNLAHGAKRMALQKVIVKRLVSIENFGSMNVLCSDKTGTLTEGVVKVNSALDVEGKESEKVLFYVYLNAFFETGFTNPIDSAIRNYRQLDVSGCQKLDEVPYDFIRKRLSILVLKDDKHLMVTKGALQNVLSVCSSAETSDGNIVDIATVREHIQKCFERHSSKGLRVLGVAYRDVSETLITKDHEAAMTFSGFIVLFDPPKPGIADTINQLHHLGISLKVVTGDNKLVAANVSHQVGLSNPQILTGSDIRTMSDEALRNRVNDISIFAEVEPNQKERIILALKKSGNVVGYIGDGVNDASALHASDVGISVDSAVDVAKDAADIVLLEKDLGVLVQGVREGRITFANTLKYVFMATSANFGNMFSMAGVSLFLPYLPLLPGQILLTNLMTDIPEMTIATDSVDGEMVDHPRRWDIGFIRNFMLVFGVLSSVFDYLTFGALFFILHAAPDQFRTGWFMESVISASLIVLVIRTKKPFFKSIPGKYLAAATLLIAAIAFLFPFIPVGKVFGFTQLPVSFLLLMGGIVAVYIIAAEMVKAVFYRRVRF